MQKCPTFIIPAQQHSELKRCFVGDMVIVISIPESGSVYLDSVESQLDEISLDIDSGTKAIKARRLNK